MRGRGGYDISMNETPIAQLADLLIASDIDICDAFLILRELLDGEKMMELADMLEICPIHACDINICVDDQRDCIDILND